MRDCSARRDRGPRSTDPENEVGETGGRHTRLLQSRPIFCDRSRNIRSRNFRPCLRNDGGGELRPWIRREAVLKSHAQVLIVLPLHFSRPPFRGEDRHRPFLARRLRSRRGCAPVAPAPAESAGLQSRRNVEERDQWLQSLLPRIGIV